MNYINSQDLDKMLQENESQHLYFEKLKIVYGYEVEDVLSGAHGVQKESRTLIN